MVYPKYQNRPNSLACLQYFHFGPMLLLVQIQSPLTTRTPRNKYLVNIIVSFSCKVMNYVTFNATILMINVTPMC